MTAVDARPVAHARTAALGVVAICTAFAAVQLALAAGAPIGEHFWGGFQPRVLSGTMPVASVGAAALLATMGATVARRAGLNGRGARWLTTASWVIAGSVALNTLGNLTSNSDVEPFALGPATVIAAVLTAVVARFRLRSGAEVVIAPCGRSVQTPWLHSNLRADRDRLFLQCPSRSDPEATSQLYAARRHRALGGSRLTSNRVTSTCPRNASSATRAASATAGPRRPVAFATRPASSGGCCLAVGTALVGA